MRIHLAWQIQQVKVRVCWKAHCAEPCGPTGYGLSFGVCARSLAVGVKWTALLVSVSLTCLSSFQVIKACNAKTSLLQGSHREGWGSPQPRLRTPCPPQHHQGLPDSFHSSLPPLPTLHTEVNFLL